MEFHGNIGLRQNQLQKAALEVETNFPSIPVVGRIVFKDGIVYICVDLGGGTPVWVALTNQLSTYVHNQTSISDTWTITHNMNANTPNVQVYDSNSKMVIPDDITIVDRDTVVVTFGTAISGRAVIMMGEQDGNLRPNYAFEYIQTNLSDTWVVDHNLGYNPIVRVFIGNQEVQPATITHNTVNRTTITFSTQQLGVARFI